MRDMYDSVTPADIPSSALMIAGYVDGPYRWSAAGWARFPNAVKVRIATRASTNDGNCLDVERGDASPLEAPEWVEMRRRAGVWPSVYCNQLFGWSDVRQAFRNAGVIEPPYWVARYNNVKTIPADAVAKQYANSTMAGGHYDLSVVADYWPGIDEGVNVLTPEDGAVKWTAASPYDQAVESHSVAQWLGSAEFRTRRFDDLLNQLITKLDALLEVIRQQPTVRAQAIADALGPDLGAAVLAALKAKL